MCPGKNLPGGTGRDRAISCPARIQTRKMLLPVWRRERHSLVSSKPKDSEYLDKYKEDNMLFCIDLDHIDSDGEEHELGIWGADRTAPSTSVIEIAIKACDPVKDSE